MERTTIDSLRNKSELSDRTHNFFATINEGCLRRIDRASVAVLGVQYERIVHDRTGVLYRIGCEHFILTASHDLHDIVNANIPLYVSMNKPGVMPLPLGPAKFHSSDDEVFDLAAIWLPPDMAKEIAQHKDFLPHSQIDYGAASRRGPFVFFGYPSTVELKDHTVLVVYYEEGAESAVRAARFRVTDDGIEQLGWH